jgi:hypothetical protein
LGETKGIGRLFAEKGFPAVNRGMALEAAKEDGTRK